jgi:hypothetical protein
MMNAYSKDLTDVKVLSTIERAIPHKGSLRPLFGVSLSRPSSAGSREGALQGTSQHPQDPRQRPSLKGAALRQWLPQTA